MNNDTSDGETQESPVQVVENKENSEAKPVKKKRVAKKKLDSDDVEVQKKSRKKKAATETLESFEVVCHETDNKTEIKSEDFVAEITFPVNPNNVPEPEVLEHIELVPEEPKAIVKKPSRKKGSVFDIIRWRRLGR